MINDIVLKVDGLGKTFKVYQNPIGRIKEWLTFGKYVYHKKFVALKDISFEVRKGGFLGIIGPNGAGKSTLLKVITGVLEPTSGSYKASGKILSLLELSGGMDPDLTGRENIIRSAQLLGFPPQYLEDRMTQIEEFAELGDFFDRPIGIYSSGMRIRLAFSMFAFLECDVLILDEVLAVGDIFFRQKCYARLEELIKRNTAIILVTHSTGTVSQYCNHVIVMEKGSIYYYGRPDVAIQKYFEIKKDQGVKIKVSDTYVEEDYVSKPGGSSGINLHELDWPNEAFFGSGVLPQKKENNHVELTHLLVCDKSGTPRQVFEQGELACFYYSFLAKTNLGVPIAGVNLLTVTNLLVHGKNSLQYKISHPLRISSGDSIRYRQAIKIDLSPGRYIFTLYLSTLHPSDYSQIDMISKIEYKEKIIPVITISPAGVLQVISMQGNSAVPPHTGICNLDGSMYSQVVATSLS